MKKVSVEARATSIEVRAAWIVEHRPVWRCQHTVNPSEAVRIPHRETARAEIIRHADCTACCDVNSAARATRNATRVAWIVKHAPRWRCLCPVRHKEASRLPPKEEEWAAFLRDTLCSYCQERAYEDDDGDADDEYDGDDFEDDPDDARITPGTRERAEMLAAAEARLRGPKT